MADRSVYPVGTLHDTFKYLESLSLDNGDLSSMEAGDLLTEVARWHVRHHPFISEVYQNNRDLVSMFDSFYNKANNKHFKFSRYKQTAEIEQEKFNDLVMFDFDLLTYPRWMPVWAFSLSFIIAAVTIFSLVIVDVWVFDKELSLDLFSLEKHRDWFLALLAMCGSFFVISYWMHTKQFDIFKEKISQLKQRIEYVDSILKNYLE